MLRHHLAPVLRPRACPPSAVASGAVLNVRSVAPFCVDIFSSACVGASRIAHLATLVLPAHDLSFSSNLTRQFPIALSFCVRYHAPTSPPIAPHRKHPFFLLIACGHSLACSPYTFILLSLTHCFVIASIYTLSSCLCSVSRSHSACVGVPVECSFRLSGGHSPHLLPPTLCCFVHVFVLLYHPSVLFLSLADCWHLLLYPTLVYRSTLCARHPPTLCPPSAGLVAVHKAFWGLSDSLASVPTLCICIVSTHNLASE